MARKFTPEKLIELKATWAGILAYEAVVIADITDLIDDPIGVAIDVQEKRLKKVHKRKLDFIAYVQAGGTGGPADD